MPVERRELSVSQFAELLGVEAERVLGVEKRGSTMVLILEPEVTNGDDIGVIPATESRHDRGQQSTQEQHEEDHGNDGDREENNAL